MTNKQIKSILRNAVVGTLPLLEMLKEKYGVDSAEYRESLREYNKCLDVLDEIPDEGEYATEA
jgi:hypothetical protein